MINKYFVHLKFAVKQALQGKNFIMEVSGIVPACDVETAISDLKKGLPQNAENVFIINAYVIEKVIADQKVN